MSSFADFSPDGYASIAASPIASNSFENRANISKKLPVTVLF